MTARSRVKARTASARLVAVISSPADLQAAAALRRPPDYFELRLDALYPVLPEAGRFISRLAAPLIITARHPFEAGMNNLSPGRRCDLLLRYLPRAKYVDVELRSVPEMHTVLDAAKQQRVKRIISLHDFHRTPPVSVLKEMLQSAKRAAADIFKIVTRTDDEEEFTALLEFFEKNKSRIAISAMGTGKLGREARIRLAQRGSALNYVHLGLRQVAGQLSLSEMRRILD